MYNIVYSLFDVSLFSFQIIDRCIGLRLTPEEEQVGTDYVEHDITPPGGVPLCENGTPLIRRRHPCTGCCRSDDVESRPNNNHKSGHSNSAFEDMTASQETASTKM